MVAAYHPTINGNLVKRVNLFRFIREFIEISGFKDGYYMEFGVLNGECMIDAYRTFRGSSVKHYFGFDTFCGIPELSDFDNKAVEYTPIFTEGNFKSMRKEFVEETILSMPRIQKSNLTLIEGTFEESFKKMKPQEFSKFGIPLIVYIDCDLYSSAKDVLNFIKDIIVDGTWILFDDFWTYRGSPFMGEQKAINEWLIENPNIGLQDYGNFNGFGKAFIVYKNNEL